MNRKKVESLKEQLTQANRIDIKNFGICIEVSVVENICGKPNNIVLSLGGSNNWDIEGFLFTEQNLNDANIDKNHNLIIRDTKNKKHIITIFPQKSNDFLQSGVVNNYDQI